MKKFVFFLWVLATIGLTNYALNTKQKPQNKKISLYDDTYIGELYQSKFYGLGKIHFRNGDYYEGSFLDGKFNGKGILHSSKGYTFEGNFLDGFPEKEGYFNVGNTQIKVHFKKGVIQ